MNATKTKKQVVLSKLKRKTWVDATEIEEATGPSGLRRLRELRENGLNIEKRPHPEYIHEWQYRLVK